MNDALKFSDLGVSSPSKCPRPGEHVYGSGSCDAVCNVWTARTWRRLGEVHAVVSRRVSRPLHADRSSHLGTELDYYLSAGDAG
jgi:hypothetical protein